MIMAMLHLCVRCGGVFPLLLLLLLMGASITLSDTTGVLRLTTNIKYKDNNIIIGRNASGVYVDLGNWSPGQYTPWNDFKGRYLRSQFNNAQDERRIDIYLKNPTAEDRDGPYVCRDGSSRVPLDCTASYRVDNSGTSLDMHSGLVVLMVVLALYVMIGA